MDENARFLDTETIVNLEPVKDENKETESSTQPSTRICLVGDVCNDEELSVVAQAFGLPVVVSETGAEYVEDDSHVTLFVLREFSGPTYDALARLKQRIVSPIVLRQCAVRGEPLPCKKCPVYSLTMSGVVVCFTGFRVKEDLVRLATYVHSMGGGIRRAMVTKVTHLVSNCCMGEKYQYAVTFRVPIMSEAWVMACWERRHDLAAHAASEELMANKLDLFHGARLCFYGFTDDEREHMAEILQENGGVVVELADKSCTHVVVVSGEKFNVLKANLVDPDIRNPAPVPSTECPRGEAAGTSTPRARRERPPTPPVVSPVARSPRVASLPPLPPRCRPRSSLPAFLSCGGRPSRPGPLCDIAEDAPADKTRRLSLSHTSPHSLPCQPPPGTREEERPVTQPRVVDDATVQNLPEAETEDESFRAHVVKAEWFWQSIQNQVCADEKEYLFEDYLESIISPNRSGAMSGTPGSSLRNRKRKRLRDTVSRLLQTYESPTTQKRRSSVSDAGLLSMSGSFLDASGTSADRQIDEEAEPVSSDTPRKNQSARQQVFMELVQTESNYVKILETIMVVYKAPLEDRLETGDPLLSKVELNTVFGNLGPIYDIHKKMLADLRYAYHNWREDFSIGEIFLKFAPDLVKAYPSFVNFFECTKEMLLQCDQTRPRFHAFLKVGQMKPECGRQSLQELLIRPVQRLPSISLLLNDIQKHTAKSNPDHAALEQALSKIREVMTYINEDKRKTESQMVMFGIYNEIDSCPAYLVSSQRHFVVRCEVMELSEGLSGRGDILVLHLFTDVLEVCKRRSKVFNSMKSPNTTGSTLSLKQGNCKPYKHIRLMPLTHIKKVIDIRETEDCHKVFALMCRVPQELKERVFSFTMLDDDADKAGLLKIFCRQVANAFCRTDAEEYLSTLDSNQLDIDTSDALGGTLSKAFKFASRTRMKVGRAFSFNKTPGKMKRAVSTMVSPFGSTTNLTPPYHLSQMRLASCNNLSELAGRPAREETYVAPMSVQPTRKNKCSSMTMPSLRRL
ncbi:protein ECT2 [Bacillus rossius redtenbacheri]|uniref:protein ECT2 n=1 Tax=Bacillus rossius redtenbacheri TaxID=93214 RepID=UPI002FDE3892